MLLLRCINAVHCRRGEARARREDLRLKPKPKNFARAQFNQGLIVLAGTINLQVPRRLIPSSSIPSWLECAQDQDIGDRDDGQEAEKTAKKLTEPRP
jgi:hypothetical protein